MSQWPYATLPLRDPYGNGHIWLLLIFDNLVANRDSNSSNLLIDANWRLWFNDCACCFGKTNVLY